MIVPLTVEIEEHPQTRGIPGAVIDDKDDDYTLVLADNGHVLSFSAIATLTVPAGLGKGFQVGVVQNGADQVTVAGSGATVNSQQGFTKTAGQYAAISLLAYDIDTFVLLGDGA